MPRNPDAYLSKGTSWKNIWFSNDDPTNQAIVLSKVSRVSAISDHGPRRFIFSAEVGGVVVSLSYTELGAATSDRAALLCDLEEYHEAYKGV